MAKWLHFIQHLEQGKKYIFVIDFYELFIKVLVNCKPGETWHGCRLWIRINGNVPIWVRRKRDTRVVVVLLFIKQRHIGKSITLDLRRWLATGPLDLGVERTKNYNQEIFLKKKKTLSREW